MAVKKQTNPHMRSLEIALSTVYGWAANPSSRNAIQRVVAEKAQRLGLDEVTYCRMAVKSPGELNSVAEEIALGETCFFREPEQFRSLKSFVLPELVERRQPERKLRLWSAGCSSGEEPFSLAILLDEILPDQEGWRIEVFAVDLRSRALLEASQGRYQTTQLRNLNQNLRERYFSGPQSLDGTLNELDRRIRRNVKFRHANLYDPQLWQHLPGQFDFIVCSNVLMHLTSTAIQQTVNRLYQALTPKAYLMVGTTEPSFIEHSRLRPAQTLPPGFFIKTE